MMRLGGDVIDFRESQRILQTELESSMAEVGFRVTKRGGTLFVKDFNAETNLWVSLQILRDHKPKLGLFPRVGFVNFMIDRFFRESLALSKWYGQESVVTFSKTLGYLVPESDQVEWYFDPKQVSFGAPVKTIVRYLIDYGMPFMTRYPTLDALVEWAESPGPEPYSMTNQPLLRPVIFYLSGQIVRANEILSAEISKFLENGDREHPAFEPYMRFEEILIGRLRIN